MEPAFVAYEGYVLYRCRFGGPGGFGPFFLRFGGVYYAARVWLNGAYLGRHEGYFAAFEFDVTDAVSGGANELLVEVYSPEEPEENDRKTVGGVWARWDGMASHLNPGGIFREVSLIGGSQVRILSVKPAVDTAGCGKVSLELYAREDMVVEISGRVRPVGFDAPGADFHVSKPVRAGSKGVAIDLHLAQPRLWWTWDRGDQPLYELTLECGGNRERVRFGVRSVELRNWTFYLNGERVFLRGINALPTDAYPGRATREDLVGDAALVREANMNAVRVHAHVAEDPFYGACDELGLLVLQDFPLQWGHRRDVLEGAVNQAREMARMLAQHPSVGLYLAHDEPFYVVPPEKWTVFGLLRTAAEVLAPRWALWQRRVLGPAVVGALLGEDPTRPVIDAAGHPLTTNHLYFGWYYGRFRDLERAVRLWPGLSRFPTEYGAQALPDADTLEEIWPSGRQPDWDSLCRNYRLQVGRMTRYVPYPGDREAFVRESQEYQGEVLKHATEFFRRRKYEPTGGAFPFMLNDPAPAISWSVVDWNRRKKAAYEVVREAMSPLLFCAEYPLDSYEPGTMLSLPLFAVNDLPHGLEGVRWTWTLEVSGTRISSGGGEVGIPADSAVQVGLVEARLTGRGRAELGLKLETGAMVATNRYEFSVRKPTGRRNP